MKPLDVAFLLGALLALLTAGWAAAPAAALVGGGVSLRTVLRRRC